MATAKKTMNSKRTFAVIALVAACAGATLPVAEASAADFEQQPLSAHVVKSAAPKAPASYTQAMLEELREAEASRQLMPYLLALHVNGKTSDGFTVRINVPVRFTGVPAELVQGLFPRGGDAVGQARLVHTYAELESIFSEELHKISQHFHSTSFYQPERGAAQRCEVGRKEVCDALQAPLQAALQRAQQDKPYTLHIVQEWVNFYGFFDLAVGESSSMEGTSTVKALAERSY